MESFSRSPSFLESAGEVLSEASAAYETLPAETFVAEDGVDMLDAVTVQKHAED